MDSSNRINKKISTLILTSILFFGLSFCPIGYSAATAKVTPPPAKQSGNAFTIADDTYDYNDNYTVDNPKLVDPYEKLNRKIFAFNRGVDTLFIRPVAKVYDFVLPNIAKQGVGNFFYNIQEIPSVANDLLQGNFIQGVSDTWRFAINSTVGVLGLFDVASRLGLARHEQDLGLTFAKWGARNTPYFVIPILGPSTISDAVAWPLYYEFMTIWPYVNPQSTRYSLLALDLVRIRARFLQSDQIINQAFDPYILVRNAYLQHRAYLIDKMLNNTNKNKVKSE